MCCVPRGSRYWEEKAASQEKAKPAPSISWHCCPTSTVVAHSREHILRDGVGPHRLHQLGDSHALEIRVLLQCSIHVVDICREQHAGSCGVQGIMLSANAEGAALSLHVWWCLVWWMVMVSLST